MGDDLRDWIGQHAQARQASVGEVLIQEGSTTASLWLVEAGEAWVTTTGPDGLPIRLSALHAGALVGEMTLLEGRPAVASVIAGEGCRVIPLEPQALTVAMESSSILARDVYSLFARKLALQLDNQNQDIHRWRQSDVAPLRKGLLLFAHLNEVDVEWLAQMGQRRRFPAGAVMIHQGESVPDLLLVLQGMASVLLETPAGMIEVGISRPGELLGEMSLVGSSDRATATVVARDPGEVLAMPKDRLRQRLASDPAMGARFYHAMSMLLSQRSRDQLLTHGLAATAMETENHLRGGASSEQFQVAQRELEDAELLGLEQMASISRAGQRFHWLCRRLGINPSP
ncbi:MAG: cyclic nucleotide-binding domain-containing protein [Synechococcaceae cyanobacterium]|nr:cyclic nucleotide-binding domain-containing protein [Synechococcaceae cyanobacterium]